MNNYYVFRKYLEDNNINMQLVANFLNISLKDLNKKIDGFSDFTLDEYQKIQEYLRLENEEIYLLFFPKYS